MSCVELADSSEAGARSPVFHRRLVTEALQRIRGFQPTKVLNLALLKRAALFAIGGLLAFAAAAAMFGDRMPTAIARIVNPLADIPPNSGVHFDVLVNHAGNLHQPSKNRSIYLCQLRNSPPPELAAFDLPSGIKVTGKRNQTLLPTQSLFLLNSDFVTEQARHFSDSLEKADTDTDMRIREAWRRALSREPEATEIAGARYLLETLEPQSQAWPALCQSLLAGNEFRYVD